MIFLQKVIRLSDDFSVISIAFQTENIPAQAWFTSGNNKADARTSLLRVFNTQEVIVLTPVSVTYLLSLLVLHATDALSTLQ